MLQSDLSHYSMFAFTLSQISAGYISRNRTERNNFTKLSRYKVRNGMAITWDVCASCHISSFTGLYTSCAPRISMNEYNIIVSVLLLHSSFKNFQSCCKIAIHSCPSRRVEESIHMALTPCQLIQIRLISASVT